ncbi:MAG: ABC transporter ATP-binding protein, partial [Clostridiales bacterium]|nr:ABC transporter ATP-binding protein [Clostridiales bacterium]
MAKPIVKIRNISKKIGKRLIIDDLSMDIYPGEVLGLLAPNGAGKTTTIRMMLGLASLTKGEIYIDGYSIRSQFTDAIANVGGIVENPEMYKYMSGRDNLEHYARMHGGISKDRFDEVINFIGLENRINDKVRRYSLGMRQRLGVAQAIMHSPKLLVLDEPTNGLDP